MLTRAEIEHIKKNSREIAVSAYDLMQGYTMEFASSPEDHRNEYSRYEETFIALCDMALAWLEVQPLLKQVSEISLRDSNGGRDNAIASIHDAADVVKRIRAFLSAATPDKVT